MLLVRSFKSLSKVNGGGGVYNTTLGIFLIVAFFFFCSNSSYVSAQVVEPEFNHCTTHTGVQNCDTNFTPGTIDYEYKPGCILKLQVKFKTCNPNTYYASYDFEVDGFSISEGSTGCQDLLDSLYPGWRGGSGTLDEVKYRSMILGIYKHLADIRMQLLIGFGIITPQIRETEWACSYPGSPLPSHNQPYFFTALEATCMRTCAMLYREWTIGVGGGHTSVTRKWFFSHKKCYNTCCLVRITYCWDTSVSPAKWKRSVTRYNNGTEYCPTDDPNYPLQEGCIFPIGISISDILFMDDGDCQQTCENLYEFQHLDW